MNNSNGINLYKRKVVNTLVALCAVSALSNHQHVTHHLGLNMEQQHKVARGDVFNLTILSVVQIKLQSKAQGISLELILGQYNE